MCGSERIVAREGNEDNWRYYIFLWIFIANSIFSMNDIIIIFSREKIVTKHDRREEKKLKSEIAFFLSAFTGDLKAIKTNAIVMPWNHK